MVIGAVQGTEDHGRAGHRKTSYREVESAAGNVCIIKLLKC